MLFKKQNNGLVKIIKTSSIPFQVFIWLWIRGRAEKSAAVQQFCVCNKQQILKDGLESVQHLWSVYAFKDVASVWYISLCYSDTNYEERFDQLRLVAVVVVLSCK